MLFSKQQDNIQKKRLNQKARQNHDDEPLLLRQPRTVINIHH